MRPSGGFTPDMINFGQSVDTYQIYADMICYNKIVNVNMNHPKYYCAYAARRDRLTYEHDYAYIKNKYYNNLCMNGRMSEVLAGALGNDYYIAKFDNLEQVKEFIATVLKHKE